MITVSTGFDRHVIAENFVLEILTRTERILRAFVQDGD